MLKNIISTFFTKGVIAVINLAILLVSSKQLGSSIIGQVSLLILNVAIIQIINEIYTGYSLVYFIPNFSLKKTYNMGIVWTIVCTLICSIIITILFFLVDGILIKEYVHLFFLTFIIVIHSFHMVILLAKEKIKTYNFLNFMQPALLLVILLISFFICNIKTINSYITGLYISFGIPLVLSTYYIIQIFKKHHNLQVAFEPKAIIRNGFYNQVANLCHTLSNRFNFYLLGNTVLVGVYARSSSLIESVWMISGSVSPIILTHIANTKNRSQNAILSLLLAKICFILSFCCVVVIYFIPIDFFVYLLGKDFSNVKTIMLYLAPGILCISFATIISHYFAGLGKQKILLIANGCGLLSTISTSHYLVSKYQILGACYSTVLSYFVASIILLIMFMKENKMNIIHLLTLGADVHLLKNDKSA